MRKKTRLKTQEELRVYALCCKRKFDYRMTRNYMVDWKWSANPMKKDRKDLCTVDSKDCMCKSHMQYKLCVHNTPATHLLTS